MWIWKKFIFAALLLFLAYLKPLKRQRKAKAFIWAFTNAYSFPRTYKNHLEEESWNGVIKVFLSYLWVALWWHFPYDTPANCHKVRKASSLSWECGLSAHALFFWLNSHCRAQRKGYAVCWALGTQTIWLQNKLTIERKLFLTNKWLLCIMYMLYSTTRNKGLFYAGHLCRILLGFYVRLL